MLAMFFVPFFSAMVLVMLVIFKKNIGLIQTEQYAPVIVKAITSAGQLFTILPVSNEDEGKRWIKEKKIDGLLLRSVGEHQSVVLVVLKKESLQALSIVESLSALQKAAEGKSASWIMDITPLQEGGIQ